VGEKSQEKQVTRCEVQAAREEDRIQEPEVRSQEAE